MGNVASIPSEPIFVNNLATNQTLLDSYSDEAINDIKPILLNSTFYCDSNSNYCGLPANKNAVILTNLGIGTTNPVNKLDINGTVGISSTNTVEFGQGVSGKEINAGKIGYQRFSGGLDIVGAGASTSPTRTVTIWDNADIKQDLILSRGTRPSIYPTVLNNSLQIRSNGAGQLQLNQDNNGDVVLVGGGGQVGIANSNPAYSLDVIGTSRFSSAGSPNYLINLGSTGVGSYRSAYIYGDGTNMIFNNQQSGEIRFATNNSNKMYIKPDGSVGINTSTPMSTLDVGGNICFNYIPAGTTTSKKICMDQIAAKLAL